MKFAKASPAERAALVRMVSASANIVVIIGRSIKDPSAHDNECVQQASAEFIDAIIGVQESE